MKNTVQLFDILTCELEACKKCLEIQKEKKEILVKGNIEEFDCIVRSEQSTIMKLESLEHKRINLLSEDGLQSLPLSKIISDYIPDDLKTEYNEVHENLNKTLNQFKEISDLNQKLLKERLATLNHLEKSLSSKGYSRKGEKDFSERV